MFTGQKGAGRGCCDLRVPVSVRLSLTLAEEPTMTDPRYPGSGPPYGGGYPPPGGGGQYGGQDPYGQPGRYGGGQPGQYGTPTQGSPYGSPYDSPSPYGTPPKKGSGLKVAGIVIVALVLSAGLSIGGLYLIGSKTKHNNNAAPAAATAGASSTGANAGASSAAPGPKSTDPNNAKVGDCLAGETMDRSTAKEVTNIKIVRCDAADAKYKVVGIVAGKTEAQFNVEDNICAAYPSAVSELWQGRTGQVGSVLCLAPAEK